jgi:hypothetical protein
MNNSKLMNSSKKVEREKVHGKEHNTEKLYQV